MTHIEWTRRRVFFAGVLTTITVTAIIHGDPLWLLFMFSAAMISLAAGLVIGRARRINDDIYRFIHDR